MQNMIKFLWIEVVFIVLFLSACGNLKAEEEYNANLSIMNEISEDNNINNEPRRSEEGNISLSLKKIPFQIEMKDNQFITICDIWNSRILCYVWHWNDSYTFALMDQIIIWDMDRHKIEKTVYMNQEYLFSAVLDYEGGIYLSCANVIKNQGEKWDIFYLENTETEFKSLKNGISTLEAGWGSPWLTHLGNQIICVYEEMKENRQSQFGSFMIEGGKIKELDMAERSQNEKYTSNGISAGEDYFTYLIEKGKNLYFRVVSINGEVEEFLWENKGYGYVIAGNYLIQSGQGEKEGQNVIYVHDIKTREKKVYKTKSNGFRMLAAEEESFYSVDSFYNIYYTKLEKERILESLIEVPKELNQKNVRFLTDQKHNVYFVYEDIPDKNYPLEIYIAEIRN